MILIHTLFDTLFGCFWTFISHLSTYSHHMNHMSTSIDYTELVSEETKYGVELEFVFAFHEEELPAGSQIIKSLDYFTREDRNTFTLVDYPNHIYNSWGVVEQPATEPRPYDGEPQAILKRKLDERCPHIPTKTFGTIYGSKKTLEYLKYDQWMITVDHSVNGVGSDNIQKRLPNHEIKPDKWDSYGIEMVSPILSTGSPSHKEEIRQLIEAAVGTPQDSYGSCITNQCGLHVHVEAPESMEVLKELAILLVLYEEEISRLHAPVRRPGHPAAFRQLESNRLFFLDVDEDNWTRVGGDYSTEALLKAYGDIPRVRSGIKFLNDKTSLSRRMCWPASKNRENGNRNRLVNFTYLCRGDGYAETIEFRQARGSLDPEEISHWVDFSVGLVTLAGFYSQNPEAFPAKTFEGLHSGKGVFQLMEDMGLRPEAIQFWQERRRRYESFLPGGEDDRTDCELPPVDD